jgi:DNA-binding cell septation regulator SpoVG
MVEIISGNEFPGDRPLKMSFDIRVDGWVLYGVRVLQSEGRPAWVAMPQRTWKGPDGKTQYLPLVTPPPEVQEAIDKAVLLRFAEKMNEGSNA